MTTSQAGPSRYPTPIPGAALPLTFTLANQTVLIIGHNRLAATRAFAFLEAEATVLLASSVPEEELYPELGYRIQQGQIRFIKASPACIQSDGKDAELVDGEDGESRFYESLFRDHPITLIAITDTLIGTPLSYRRSISSAEYMGNLARKWRIPINISDMPHLSTYSFPSVHRFTTKHQHRDDGETEPGKSALQVSVSTHGNGCRLATRIKRDIVARLPRGVGEAVDNVGRMRRRAAELDADAVNAPVGAEQEHGRRVRRCSRSQGKETTTIPGANEKRIKKLGGVSEEDLDTPLNTPVPQLISRNPLEASLEAQHKAADGNGNGSVEDIDGEDDSQLRRMRWVHQMSEYYSYDALARMSPEEMDAALTTYSTPGRFSNITLPHHDSTLVPRDSSRSGRIYLVGSGPGHPGLLTMAAHHILKTATLILSDKLVPSEILALIPSTTPLHIAKKFPGNAEGAQNEMMELALQGAQAGEIVVRLKQGDPFVYGRGGEEVLYFREHGFECTVVPGVSSALAGPLMMGIPVTQRGVAESLTLCTGVGRKGKAVQLPGYTKSRSLVVLMGVARIASIVDVLTNPTAIGRDGTVFPKHLPIAVIERASSPDQRIILSTLENIEEAIRSMEERPPGMMVIGWSALCLEGKGRVDILDQADTSDEQQIVKEWLGDQSWKVREGLSREWEELLTTIEL